MRDLKEGDKVYVTRWALSQGIVVKKFRGYFSRYEQGTKILDKASVFLEDDWSAFKLGRDAHRTRKEARARVLAMIAKRREGLEKQVAKLDKLEGEMRR